ncbi:hypothetical protein Pint_10581 [Pistacia integerrima]|uniref:Uncharacterized protein n=1 Tax=Pistacia integerrima TaxID=434235 RepID=A0ACC0XF97_9ROSI|nr:hypothetical protein Pint_10581 [Pistacia integerrima]
MRWLSDNSSLQFLYLLSLRSLTFPRFVAREDFNPLDFLQLELIYKALPQDFMQFLLARMIPRSLGSMLMLLEELHQQKEEEMDDYCFQVCNLAF